MTTLLFHAVPLTPIHIGDGTPLRPEDFLIEGNEMLRFSPIRVIADMSPDDQRQFVDVVGGGNLKKAQELVRRALDREAHVFERIAVGREAVDYLRGAVENPDQRGEASPFVRTAGRPFVPGSSLKGAFRTALTSDRANISRRAEVAAAVEPKLEKLQRELPRLPKTGPISDELQQIALDYDRGATEGDPLRDVAVADAVLGPGATRFDKVTVGWTPRGRDDARKGRQLHVERLLSVIDRCAPGDVAFTVALTIAEVDRQQARKRLDPKKVPRAPVDPGQLLEATDAFHAVRWQDELERLFTPGSPVRRRLEDARRRADAYAQTLEASSAPAGVEPVLARLGRFTGFESKSVETWRRGWAPQTKKLLDRAGTHGMLTDGADALPFGWVLLCPASVAVAERTASPRPTAAPVEPAGSPRPQSQPAPRPAGRRASVGGEPVEILNSEGGKLCVRIVESGDTEWIDASELDGE